MYVWKDDDDSAALLLMMMMLLLMMMTTTLCIQTHTMPTYIYISQAKKAQANNEVPVGAVFVRYSDDVARAEILGQGHNQTNATKNVCM